MKPGLLAFFAFLLVILPSFQGFFIRRGPVIYSISGQAQGTTYSIKYLAASQLIQKKEIDDLLNQLDSSLSLYQSYSLINAFNASKTGLKLDEHLLEVITAAQKVNRETKGAFDITIKNLSTLWGFGNQQKLLIPSATSIREVQKTTGFHHLRLLDSTLLKNHPEVKIDCDGIAQGYSVDKLSSLLKIKGIKDYVVELGGEIRVFGASADGKPWTISVDMLDQQQQRKEGKVQLSNEAITSSGNFSKYSKLSGQFYSHIIDPFSGQPIDNGMLAVTVIYKDAMTADALDNAFMVMGYKKALEFTQTREKMGVYMIYRNSNGTLSDTANAYFKEKFIPFPVASPRWQ
jgi:thiamine biosynthesis lipoprotein